jgi:adenosyl cobinamide kinase/adenosyl cobinamide phosphate guanylyltransferase
MLLLIGGARSGKSRLAVEMAERHGGPVCLIATGEASDEEMTERIERHRRERPESWQVIEESRQLDAALGQTGVEETLIIDCLTLWVSNLMIDRDDGSIIDLAKATARTASARDALTIVVTNDVGLGLVPMDPVGRRYRDLLGLVNREFSRQAEKALLVVAGRTLELERPGYGP